MADIARLTVALRANSAQFVSDLQQSKKVAKNWTKDVASSFASMAKTTGVAAGAATAAVAGVGFAVKASLDSIDEMTRTAANLSIPVQKFGDLAYAAKLSGVSMDKVADVIKDISVRIQDAAFSGGGPLADFFAQTGQSAKEWANLRPDEQFRKFVSEINKMDANQARFWLDEVNDSAAEMFNTLYGSDAAFSKFVSEAERAGLSIDQNMAHNAQLARVEFDRLFAVSSGTWQNVVASSAPAIEYVLDGLNSWLITTAKANGGFQNLGKALSTSMLEATRAATHAFFEMVDSIKAEIREMGSELGRDWFQVEDADILRSTLNDISKEMSAIERSGSWIDGNDDVPGYWQMSSEQLARYQQLQARTVEIQKQLAGETDLSGFDSTIDALIRKITDFKPPKVDLVGGQITPKPVPGKSPTQKAQEDAVKSYQDASQKMLQEQQRRIQLMQAGDNQALLQEKFNYEDRVRSLVESYQKAYDASVADKEAQKALQVQYYADLQQLSADNQEQITAIEAAGLDKRKAYQSQIAADLLTFTQQQMSITTSALADAGKEHTGIYKLMLATQKAAAIPSMIISTEDAATKALTLGPVAGPIASSAVRALGYASVGIVAGQAIGGMAHSGIDEVPREGTWLLDKGERVYTNDSVRKLDQMHSMLANGRSGGDSSQPWVINIYDAPQGTRAEVDDEKKVIAIMMSDASSGGQYMSYISQKLGVKAGGYK